MFQNFNQNNKKLTLDEGFKRYIDFCTLNKLSKYTIKNKNVIYSDFKNCVKDKDTIYCDQLTNEIIDDFKLYLAQKGNKTSTINEKVCTIMSIFNYLFEHGWCN